MDYIQLNLTKECSFMGRWLYENLISGSQVTSTNFQLYAKILNISLLFEVYLVITKKKV